MTDMDAPVSHICDRPQSSQWRTHVNNVVVNDTPVMHLAWVLYSGSYNWYVY